MEENISYNVEVSGIGFQNKDGEERKDIVRKFLDNEFYEENVTAYLKREKGNRSDKNAIAVYLNKKGIWYEDDAKIGYLPREYAKDISPQLNNCSE